ncbi:hypothetical protein Syun_014645 [Stephania yunnanensis]|uniref:Uncharacterized protein n=1 Tax=Stephania yunnanensis TaxID=152371 RepID=A0AAP0JLW2_9MAGN
MSMETTLAEEEKTISSRSGRASETTICARNEEMEEYRSLSLLLCRTRACITVTLLPSSALAKKATYLQACLMHAHFAKKRRKRATEQHSKEKSAGEKIIVSSPYYSSSIQARNVASEPAVLHEEEEDQGSSLASFSSEYNNMLDENKTLVKETINNHACSVTPPLLHRCSSVAAAVVRSLHVVARIAPLPSMPTLDTRSAATQPRLLRCCYRLIHATCALVTIQLASGRSAVDTDADQACYFVHGLLDSFGSGVATKGRTHYRRPIRRLWLVRAWEHTHRSRGRIIVLDGQAQSYASTLQQPSLYKSLAVARDRVIYLVECTDKDNDLVMHRDKDMDMFHLDWDFHVSVWASGQPGTDSSYCHDVALAYIDGRRQMVSSLLGGLGEAQPVTEEPSLSRRSPALQSKMGVWHWAEFGSSAEVEQDENQKPKLFVLDWRLQGRRREGEKERSSIDCEDLEANEQARQLQSSTEREAKVTPKAGDTQLGIADA